MKVSKEMLAYRRRVGRGKIMKPSTFYKIEKKAMKKYHIGRARAAKVAGKAYYTTLAAKFKARRR